MRDLALILSITSLLLGVPVLFEPRSRASVTRPHPGPEVRVTRDISFGLIPGTDRELRCDVWQPLAHTPSSGTAIVYLHGSAWTLINKDVVTRLFSGTSPRKDTWSWT
jgi:acetyl esterase/lipase